MKCSKSLIYFITLIFVCLACTTAPGKEQQQPDDYRSEMVSFVAGIRNEARAADPSFFIIAQNGETLLTTNGEPGGPANSSYIKIIDGIAREDLFYGYEEDNLLTPLDVQQYLTTFLDLAQAHQKKVLAVDYCSTYKKIVNSYQLASSHNYISFAAPHRELNSIPVYEATAINENEQNISSLDQAKNFLYVINPGSFDSKASFIKALEQTNYDMLIIDYAFHRGVPFTEDEIQRLKTKANGGQRLVVAYMSIGEAENYRYYWQSDWSQNPPQWLEPENPNWPGNYPVKYWTPEWQEIIYKSKDSYLSRILAAGFDGVYLDRVDTFEYFKTQ